MTTAHRLGWILMLMVPIYGVAAFVAMFDDLVKPYLDMADRYTIDGLPTLVVRGTRDEATLVLSFAQFVSFVVAHLWAFLMKIYMAFVSPLARLKHSVPIFILAVSGGFVCMLIALQAAMVDDTIGQLFYSLFFEPLPDVRWPRVVNTVRMALLPVFAIGALAASMLAVIGLLLAVQAVVLCAYGFEYFLFALAKEVNAEALPEGIVKATVVDVRSEALTMRHAVYELEDTHRHIRNWIEEVR